MGFRQVRPSLSVNLWSLSGPTHNVQCAAPKPGAYECALHLWQRRPSWLANPVKMPGMALLIGRCTASGSDMVRLEGMRGEGGSEPTLSLHKVTPYWEWWRCDRPQPKPDHRLND